MRIDLLQNIVANDGVSLSARAILLILLGSSALNCSSSGSPSCMVLDLNIALPTVTPVITVMNKHTSAPICDADVQVTSGQPGTGSGSAAVQEPTDTKLNPWIKSDSGLSVPINQLQAGDCHYLTAAEMTQPGVYTLLVARTGFQSVAVSNVLLQAAVYDACGNPEPESQQPAAQKIDVELVPLGSP